MIIDCPHEIDWLLMNECECWWKISHVTIANVEIIWIAVLTWIVDKQCDVMVISGAKSPSAV